MIWARRYNIQLKVWKVWREFLYIVIIPWEIRVDISNEIDVEGLYFG